MFRNTDNVFNKDRPGSLLPYYRQHEQARKFELMTFNGDKRYGMPSVGVEFVISRADAALEMRLPRSDMPSISLIQITRAGVVWVNITAPHIVGELTLRLEFIENGLYVQVAETVSPFSESYIPVAVVLPLPVPITETP